MSTSSLQKNPIAIIGQAAVFAKAASLDEYWDNILHKIDGITEVPPSRWDPEEYYDPDPGAPDKTYCKRGGFIPPIDFDPLEFGLPPNLLEVTDSSQLLGLVVARDAMEDAGYGLDREFNRQETGVVLGVAGGQKLITDLSARLQYPIWEKVLRNSGISAEDTEIIIDKIKMAYAPWNENSFPGLLGNVIAGRIANRLDLGGMNTVVDAACASSLAAVKAAVSELLEGRAEMMISGGVDTDNSPFTFLCFSKTPAFSPSQQTRPFDAQSDGMLIGEGLGMMVLKRLEDAERDGDRIYAVIRGIGSSSDGKFKSIYAPRPSGQSLAIRRAYQDAGFDPPDIGLVEAHGTGTKAGDPAEFEGLNTIFGSPNGKGQSIAIGSVKSQIGHTKAAAGAAGMIKTALALHYKVLPPTLNVSQPNPALEIENTHFYLNTETRPWFSPNGKGSRKAAVSAFGFGGTNFHLVLEEYPSDAAPVFPSSRTTLPILLSAGTGDQLIRKISGWLERFSADDSRETFLALFRENSSLPEADDHPRLGFAAQNSSEAVQFLETAHKLLSGDPDSGGWDHPHGIIYRRKGLDPDVKTAALFPGQGSQYLNMGLDTVLSFPRMRTSYEAMDALFFREGLSPLTEKVFPNPALDEATRTAQSAALRETDYAQAGIGVFSYGLYNILSRSGFEPDFTAGHSFGELTALWAGGMMDDQTFLRLVKARGQAMRPPTDGNAADTGTMAAVQAHPDEVKEEIKTFSDVTVANENSPTQTVLAGPTAAVEKAAAELTRKGYKVTQLPVSAAFHTPLVKHASRPFAEAVQAETFHKAKVPVYSNTTGERYPRKLDQAKKILANHILHPVVFKTQIEELYRAGARLFVEIGPRQIMTGLVADILQDQEHTTVALNPSRDKSSERQLIEAVIKLQVLGIPLANDRLLAKNGLITEKD
ncbi:MAG: beta-ketoacyl synthase N-terminal-like domain-containing protein [Anaerolineales bacterium]|nr:beta-ketoacyl synthase N-terminal-like domain-containing protein [Anaerolineales bacterium]